MDAFRFYEPKLGRFRGDGGGTDEVPSPSLVLSYIHSIRIPKLSIALSARATSSFALGFTQQQYRQFSGGQYYPLFRSSGEEVMQPRSGKGSWAAYLKVILGEFQFYAS
jgi:hypothetical protein